MQKNKSIENISNSFDFIILRFLNSLNKAINTLGSTLYNLRDGVISTYSNNELNLSNANASITTSKVQKLINISNRIRTFKTLKKL